MSLPAVSKEVDLKGRKVIVVEFSSHAHVIAPWVQSLHGELVNVFVPKSVIVPLVSHLRGIEHNARIRDLSELHPYLQSLRRDKARVEMIITSSLEGPASYSQLFALTQIFKFGCGILCVRNAERWKFSNRRLKRGLSGFKKPVVFLKMYALAISTYVLEKSIAKKARGLVFEFESQRRLFLTYHKSFRDVPTLIFSGRVPGDFLDVQESKDYSIDKSINLGILGTLNSSRRNYNPLLSALDLLQQQGHVIKVYFLGSHVGSDSEKIKKLFGSFVCMAPTYENPYITNTEILSIRQAIDVLIAPLNQTWGYHEGKSSGALADAIYLRKPILLPKFSKTFFYPISANYYDGVQDLVQMLKNTRNLSLADQNAIGIPDLEKFRQAINSN